MKTKEKNQRLRESKTNLDRLALARDEIPGSEFDDLIAKAMLYSRPSPDDFWKTQFEKWHLFFGRSLAKSISDGNSDYFRRLADGIDLWKKHKPSPDKRLEALFEIVRLEEANQGLAQSPLPPPSVRKIICYMQGAGIVPLQLDVGQYNDIAHIIRSWNKRYKLGISGSSGRPKSGRGRKKNG